MVDEYNFLTIDEINNLTMNELREWFQNILTGLIPFPEGDRWDFPHIYIGNIYKIISPLMREVFEDVIIYHLADLAQNSNSIWLNESGDELLLLTSTIFRNTNRSEKPLDLLLLIVSKNHHRHLIKPNLHWRSVQCLVEIRYRTKPYFWKEIYSSAGEDYSGLVFSGLTLFSLAESFAWLRTVIKEQIIFDQFISRLPLLIEEHGIDSLINFIQGIYLIILPEKREKLYNFAIQMEFSLESGLLKNLSHETLLGFAKTINISVSNDITTEKLRFNIEFFFTKNYTPREYDIITPKIELISCISNYLFDHPYALSDEIRSNIIMSSKEIITNISSKKDIDYFNFEIGIIVYHQIDVTKELHDIGHRED